MLPDHRSSKNLPCTTSLNLMCNVISKHIWRRRCLTSRWPTAMFTTILLGHPNKSSTLSLYGPTDCSSTAIRYIGAQGVNSQRRQTDIVRPGPTSVLQASTIDNLYLTIMDQAFDMLEDRECILKREVLTSVVLFQTPLSMAGITSLLDMPDNRLRLTCRHFTRWSVSPSGSHGHISIFHASFREFIIDPARCRDGHHIDACQGHGMQMVRCLQLMNRSLRRNMCGLREDRVGILADEIPDLVVIPEALRYSCLHRALRLADAISHPLADVSPVLDHLCTFANEHLLH